MRSRYMWVKLQNTRHGSQKFTVIHKAGCILEQMAEWIGMLVR